MLAFHLGNGSIQRCTARPECLYDASNSNTDHHDHHGQMSQNDPDNHADAHISRTIEDASSSMTSESESSYGQYTHRETMELHGSSDTHITHSQKTYVMPTWSASNKI